MAVANGKVTKPTYEKRLAQIAALQAKVESNQPSLKLKVSEGRG